MSDKSKPVSSGNVKRVFQNCYDLSAREILLGGVEGKVKATVCYIDGLVSGITVADTIIRPATTKERFAFAELESEAIELILKGGVYSYTAILRTDLNDVIDDMLNGFCAVIFDAAGAAVTFEVRSPDKRSIDEPKEEKVVKGSKDVFIEILRTNTMQVRRKLRNPNLRLKQVTVGATSKTSMVIAYIEGYTNMKYVEEMERRLKNANFDSAVTAASVEEHIYDKPSSMFPQMLRTERPDRFCMNLLEGRVGLLIDGLPMGYLAPGTFSQFYKVPDDNAKHYIVASAMTLLRYASVIIALLLPAFYVAVVMYHQEMLPPKLLVSIIESRKSVPFPSAIEVLGMLMAFELLQEAGLRLPNTIGQTVSIIGALIVGQSAVEAKVISPVVVIVIALSGIASYTVPDQDMSAAIRVHRFILVLTAIAAGLYGVVLGFTTLIYNMCSMESFGVSYMEPFAGGKGKRLRELLRLPLTKTQHMDPELRSLSNITRTRF